MPLHLLFIQLEYVCMGRCIFCITLCILYEVVLNNRLKVQLSLTGKTFDMNYSVIGTAFLLSNAYPKRRVSQSRRIKQGERATDAIIGGKNDILENSLDAPSILPCSPLYAPSKAAISAAFSVNQVRSDDAITLPR